MKATGTLLKEAREKQNLSISEVSMSTKINPKVISAIEEGREGQLPAKTFLKGFVRSYAIYLKLDVEKVMASLQQDLGEKQTDVASVATAPATASQRKEEVESPAISANPRILKGLAVGGVLFLIVMIVTVKSLVEKYEKEKAIDPAVQTELKPEEKAPTEEAAAPTEETKPKEEEAKPAEAETAAAPSTPEPAPVAAAPAATPAAPVVAAPAPAPEKAKPVEPAKPVEVAKPVESAKPVEAKPAPAAVAAAPTAKPEVKVEAPKPVEVKPEAKPADSTTAALKDNEIILEALDKVDITFVVNNGPTTRLSLQPAQVHTIKAKGQVAMDVSDGGAVNVIHNGQDNGTLGDLGKPKKVRYP